MSIDTAHCPHFRIEHETFICEEHGPQGYWECDGCGEEFVPVSEPDAAIDRLQEAMVGLIYANSKLQGRFLAAVTLWVGTVAGALLL